MTTKEGPTLWKITPEAENLYFKLIDEGESPKNAWDKILNKGHKFHNLFQKSKIKTPIKKKSVKKVMTANKGGVARKKKK